MGDVVYAHVLYYLMYLPIYLTMYISTLVMAPLLGRESRHVNYRSLVQTWSMTLIDQPLYVYISHIGFL
jgi:hypothetical protein